jgi:hypothetical protein
MSVATSSDRHTSGTSGARTQRIRLNLPRQCQVEVADDGRPLRIDGRAVESVREHWLVDEGWWTETPVRRRYREIVLAGGRLTVVFEDLRCGGWYHQRD